MNFTDGIIAFIGTAIIFYVSLLVYYGGLSGVIAAWVGTTVIRDYNISTLILFFSLIIGLSAGFYFTFINKPKRSHL